MAKTIVFVHGAWMTPLCWENFTAFFGERGYQCVSPAWPYKDRPVEELRKNPDSALAKLGITQIVDHYEKIIREMGEPPILIGHSFGGLFVQMLLDRGLGAKGVAIDSAAPKGVFQLYPTAVRANMSVFLSWGRIARMSFPDFQYAFVNSMPQAEQQAAYDRYVVPESARIFFQAATSMLHNITRVNFQNNTRAPLLLVAGSADHLCPAAQNKSNYEKYKRSSAKTDFVVFENRTHWIIGQSGWQEVATYIDNWLGA